VAIEKPRPQFQSFSSTDVGEKCRDGGEGDQKAETRVLRGAQQGASPLAA